MAFKGGSSPRPYLEEGTGALSVPKDGVRWQGLLRVDVGLV